MKFGTVGDHLNARTVTIFAIQFLLVMTVLGYRAWTDTSIECVRCHGDRQKMEKYGFPALYMTREMVERESGHPNVQCRDCHLGDGRARSPEKAHKGMLAALIIDNNGAVLKRKDVHPRALVPEGKDRIREMLPQVAENGALAPHPDVRNVLWHDRDPVTLNFDPAIAAKTCGKPDCHPEELKQFRTTVMGANFRQRTMVTWLKPYGPQN